MKKLAVQGHWTWAVVRCWVNKGSQARCYRSVFGSIRFSRQRYYHPTEGSYYPLDACLGMPSGKYSYLLQQWLSYGSVEMTFAQSAAYLSNILGQDFRSMQTSRLSYDMASAVESYYQGYNWEEETGSHLSASFDGKGIPIKRSETDRAEESKAVKLAAGQKKQVKKEVTVSLSSSFTPKVRTTEELMAAFFEPTPPPKPPSNEPPHRWHEHKHIRAFLSDKHRAIGYGLQQLIQRDPTKAKPIIVLMDGDRGLEKAVKLQAEQLGLTPRIDAYILDFIHVLEFASD